jgi:hypothetical protein
MADWGAFIRSTDGTLLVTPDTPCYELVGEYAPTSRSGNVNTYYVPSSSYPLIFIRCGVNQAAGVLSVSAANPGYTVQVLSTVSCNILAFRIIEGSESGYGMATFAANGSLVFASSRNVLNVRNAGNISEGASFPASSGVDMVSYTCGPVRPLSSTADRWVFVNSITYPTTAFVCRSGFFPVDTFRCDFNPSTGFVDCRWVTEMRFETRCAFETVFVTEWVFANVRRTTWSIDRGTARINSGSISFQWVLHLSGFYDTVLGYQQYVDVSPSVFGSGTPTGSAFVPPSGWLLNNVQFEGQLSANNTFPYTTSRANEISLTCLAGVRSNYD